MDWIIEILRHTPWWVYALLVYLVSRGLAARKPADVTPWKLALVPGLLAGWGLYDLGRIHGIGMASLGVWLIALVAGAAIGVLLLRGLMLRADRTRGVVHRPADHTVLPLILIAFSVRYAFGVMTAVSPELLQLPLYRFIDMGSSGLFAGIFAGKFARYLRCYLAGKRDGATPASA